MSGEVCLRKLGFSEAADLALDRALAADPSVVVFGEDVPMIRRRLLARFGPERVRGTPISESAFLGAAVGAAMAGLRPVVEVMLVDFLAVGLSALQNEAAMIETLSGGRWRVPLVVRATCGGGYGDAGQHEQALWGTLAGIPGLTVVVPASPDDAAGLMRASIEHEGPVVYLEHKLLSAMWLEWLGGARRRTVAFDVPAAGAGGLVADPPPPVPIGRARTRRNGDDLTIVSLGVGVHRSLAATEPLATEHGIEATVLDLRTVSPLDVDAIADAGSATGHVLVVDEDHLSFGLSGEIAALVAERVPDARFARLATAGTVPYARRLEERALPRVDAIVDRALHLVGAPARRTP